jgi:hypothetical protein
VQVGLLTLLRESMKICNTYFGITTVTSRQSSYAPATQLQPLQAYTHDALHSLTLTHYLLRSPYCSFLLPPAASARQGSTLFFVTKRTRTSRVPAGRTNTCQKTFVSIANGMGTAVSCAGTVVATPFPWSSIRREEEPAEKGGLT